MKPETKAVDIDRNKGDFHYKVDYAKDAGSGLSEKTIQYISDAKDDPDWVREFRLRGLKTFLEKPDLELANTFIQSGDFLWNAGIFIWQRRDIPGLFRMARTVAVEGESNP